MACCQRMESTPLDPMLNLDIHRRTVVVHPDIRKKVIRLLDEKNIKEISIPKIEIDIGCVPLSNDLGDVIAEKTVEIMTDT